MDDLSVCLKRQSATSPKRAGKPKKKSAEGDFLLCVIFSSANTFHVPYAIFSEMKTLIQNICVPLQRIINYHTLMNLFKQFVGAYTRQIARNVANDNYYQKKYVVPIKESKTNIKVNQTSTLEFILWLIGCFVVPYFISFIILIKGLIHLFSDKANVTYEEKEKVFHKDRRFRHNYDPSQTFIQDTTKVDKFLKSELDPQEIYKYNRNAIIYILIGVLSIFFWYKMSTASESEMEDCTKWTSYTYDPLGKDYDEIFQPHCQNIYNYEFILPKIESKVSRDAMLVRKNDSLFLCIDDNLFAHSFSLHDSISIIMDNKEKRWTLERNDEYIFKLIKDSVDFTPEGGYNIYYIGKENISDVRLLKIFYGGNDEFIFYPHSGRTQ